MDMANDVDNNRHTIDVLRHGGVVLRGHLKVNLDGVGIALARYTHPAHRQVAQNAFGSFPGGAGFIQ
jgi:hypothetical protein